MTKNHEKNEKILSADSNVAQSLNSFFSFNSSSETITDPIIRITLKYRNNPRILTIGEVCKERSASPFSVSEVCKEEIVKYILNLDTSKTYAEIVTFQQGNTDIFAEFLHSSFNESTKKSNIPSVLKQENITPGFKKGDKERKNNYRSVSILSSISNVFERGMFRQISNYMDCYLSKYQRKFRKDYCTQNCLLHVLDK